MTRHGRRTRRGRGRGMIRWACAVGCAIVASLGVVSAADARAVSLTGTVRLAHFDMGPGEPAKRFWALEARPRVVRLEPGRVELGPFDGQRVRIEGDLRGDRLAVRPGGVT